MPNGTLSFIPENDPEVFLILVNSVLASAECTPDLPEAKSIAKQRAENHVGSSVGIYRVTKVGEYKTELKPETHFKESQF